MSIRQIVRRCDGTALAYEKLGIETEVKGWEAMRANKLTIYDDKEFEDKKKNEK